MLLIGIWRHGMQRWAAIADDERLGLREKLAQAAQEKLAKEPHNAPGLEHLPRGTHLETRVAGLLKRMVRARARMEAKAAAREGKAAAGGDGAGTSAAATDDASLPPPPPPPPQQQPVGAAVPAVPPLSPADISLSDSLQRSVDAVAALRASGGDPDAALRQLGAQVKTRASTSTSSASPGGAGEAGIWALVAIKIAAAAGGEGVPEQGWTGAELQARVDALFKGAAGFAGNATAAAGAPASSPPVPSATKLEASPAAAVPEVEMEEAEEKAKEEVQAPAPAVEEKKEEVAPAAAPAPAAAAVSPAAPPATTDAVMAPAAAAALTPTAPAGCETAAANASPPPLPPPQQQQQADDDNNA